MKKFENIYIASDIDGTFLWDEAYVNPKNIAAIRYFTENGGHFAFSTGRNPQDTGNIIPYWHDICNSPCIFCNGSMLYDPKTDTVINPQYIEPAQKAAEVFRTVNEKLAHIAGARATTVRGFLFAAEDAYVYERFKRKGYLGISEIVPLESIDGTGIFKIVAETTPEHRQNVHDVLFEAYGDVFELTYSAPTLVELQPKGVSKAYQLEHLRKQVMAKNPNAKFYCIGDYENDYSMLCTADVAVCPENSTPKIRGIAEIVTCHCRDGAIADLISKIEESIQP